MEDVFPQQEHVDYTQMRMTPEGLYSVTRRRDGQRVIQFLARTIPDIRRRTVTDATACVGSDTLRFSQVFQKVHSIELKRDNVVALRNNVNVFGATNVIVYEGDVTKVFKWKTDVLYIDPPWGGPDYYTKQKLDVYISNYRVDKWIEELLKDKNRPAYVVLKLPRNYNFAHLHFLPNVIETLFYRVRNFMIVSIQTKVL